MKYRVTASKKTIEGSISLPASKSISNRTLIIQALCSDSLQVHNLSDSDDTKVLHAALKGQHQTIDIGHAGTAMRFLTAYLSTQSGTRELTGSDRMKQRPLGILADALNRLGARIEYLEETGFPPLKITGSALSGKALELDGSISSQYISALLLIAPVLPEGLQLKLKGEVTSKSYIEMTLKLMSYFGIRYEWKNNVITVARQDYLARAYTVEADWSAASYWYQILAMADQGKIVLENLYLDSLQGDARIASWFVPFGIRSEQTHSGVILTRDYPGKPDKVELDFIENPDIAQTMACLCVAQGVPFHFTGLKTLKIKETDRIAGLKNELIHFGARLEEPRTGELTWDGILSDKEKMNVPLIRTYHDHRMALSFAPMAMTGMPVEIEDPMVVTKSYPHFWDDLIRTGFRITQNQAK